MERNAREKKNKFEFAQSESRTSRVLIILTYVQAEPVSPRTSDDVRWWNTFDRKNEENEGGN